MYLMVLHTRLSVLSLAAGVRSFLMCDHAYVRVPAGTSGDFSAKANYYVPPSAFDAGAVDEEEVRRRQGAGALLARRFEGFAL